ncbi:MAG: glycosyl hydrolase [Bacteroidota bacterium]
MKSTLLIGTRKGLVVCKKKPSGWKITNVHFDAIPVSIAYTDERNGTWWACLDHGHWGVKLHRSKDEGVTWEEVAAPAYPEGLEMKEGVAAVTRYLWAMQHGGLTRPSRLWIGTEPGGLFRSEDGGNSFQLVEPFWNHPSRPQWFGGGKDYAGIHSVVVDPRNEDRILVGISCAGVFESLDAGETWTVRNEGLRADFLPDPKAAIGHDPHLLLFAPSNPDILWQQNHCGIFRSTNGAVSWEDVSQKEGPANFGFAIAVADDDPGQAWVAPAVSDVHRVAVEKALCISRTDDGGKTWTALRNGLSQDFSFDIVYRHALVASGDEVIFGTTTGNLFYSGDRGDHWQTISNYLPMIYSLHFTE